MAWSNLLSNQMVSYFDASTSGIPLLSGQSHFTTLPAANQCMTKANMQAKYNLLASNLTTYASNQLVPKSAWISNVFYPVLIDTLNPGITAKYASFIFTDYSPYPTSPITNDSQFVQLYTTVSPPTVGSIIYSSNTGTVADFGGEGGPSPGWFQKKGGTNPLIYYIDGSATITQIYTSVYESPNVRPVTITGFSASRSVIGGTGRYIDFSWNPTTDNDMLHHYNLYYTETGTGTTRTIHIVRKNFSSAYNYNTPGTGKFTIRIGNSLWGNHGGADMNWHIKAIDISGNESIASNTYLDTWGGIWSTPSPTALGQTSRNWRAMCVAPNGDVYAAVTGGDIYKQTGGTGAFVATGQTSRNWTAMCAAPNGDIYAADGNANTADIYKRTGGAGNFISQGQNFVFINTFIQGLTTTSNGDIYASNTTGATNPTGNIYKRTGGVGNFVSTGQTPLAYGGMVTAPNGDIYTTSLNQTGTSGTLKIKPAASSTFSNFLVNGGTVTTIGAEFSIAPNNDMWGFQSGGDVYKLQFDQFPSGSVFFQGLGQTFRNWSATCLRTTATGYNVYFAVNAGDIYMYSYVNN